MWADAAPTGKYFDYIYNIENYRILSVLVYIADLGMDAYYHFDAHPNTYSD